VRETTRRLVETYGPSGFEERIRAVIRKEIEGLADEYQVTPLGNLVAVKRGSGKGRRILLAAHMDEIGVMVTHVDEKGFLRFTNIGGVFWLTCVGTRVVFENGTLGVIDIERKRDWSKPPSLPELYIDVGATGPDDCPVGVGDAAVFVRPFVEQGQRLISKAMDDRIGCVVLIEVMRRLKSTPHEVHFVFTTQEEVGLRGARTAAYGVDPDVAIAVDVTGTGDTPESRPMAVELGKGPAIKVQDAGLIAHPQVREMMEKAAKAAKVEYQLEVLMGGSTDAAAMQLARAGVPSGCLSIPTRHIHTPSEMVDEGDVEGAVKVLVELLGEA
jgi:endoglucanase